METQEYKIYLRSECAIFLRTAEQFGGLSNMAGGYALSINTIRIPTAEALYQACRFPHLPELQKIIIGQASPMTAKMKSKPHRKESRSDWDDVKVSIMRWCLHVKLVQHWDKFGSLLLATGDRPIVEESYRDPFWGARPIDERKLSGLNTLGCLLVDLREQLKKPDNYHLWTVQPPDLTTFHLINKPIGVIKRQDQNLSRTTAQQLIIDHETTSINRIPDAKTVHENTQPSFTFNAAETYLPPLFPPHFVQRTLEEFI